MTLQLGIRLSLDKGNVASGAEDAARSVEKIGTAAREVETAAGGMNKALAGAATTATTSSRATISAANAQTSAIGAATKATQAHGVAMQLTGAQATQLSYQLNDVFVSLASGQNPMMVAIQQGSQISQIFGGLANTMTTALGYITPLRLGIGVVAGLFLSAGKAVLDYSSKVREADVAARGVGRVVGTSAGEIGVIARAYATAGDISIDQARSMAIEFTKTGRIGSEQFGRLISVAKDFGATVGSDTETAGKQLADLFADPARGAETLSRSLNLIDESSARAIQKLAELGKISEAQTALFEAMQGRLVKYQDTLPWWRRALEHPAANAKGGESLGAALSENSPQEQLTALVERYRSVQKALAEGRTVGPLGMDVGPWLEKAESEIERLQRLIDRAERISAGNAASARLDRAGSIAVGFADRSPANSEALRRIAIEKELVNLQRGAAAPNNTAEERERIARAIEADTRALSTWISEADRARELDKLDLALMATRDPIERASLEAERVRVQTRGQAITTTEATAAVERTYARSIGEVSAQVRGSIVDITADAAARTKVNALVASGAISAADAAREIQIEAQTRQINALAAQKEGAEKERLLAQAGELRAAITAQSEAEKRASAQQSIAGGRDRLETLQAELGLVGQVETERRKVLASLQAEQEIRRQSLDTSSAEAAQIRANAAAEAELTAQVDRRRRALEQARGRQLDSIDLSVMATRDPAARASLEAERARIQARSQGLDETEAAAAAERAYARSIGEVSAQVRGSIVDITADAAARTKVNALVASGAISAADAAREIQIEAQTRQINALAAQKEGAEKERLLAQAGELRAAITAQSEAEKRASAQQSIAGGRDRLETLQAEIALVGRSEAEHDRVMGLLQAQQEIRRLNLDTESAEARAIRDQAVAAAELNSELQRTRGAWDEVKSTGGSAIDTMVEGLRTGKDVSEKIAEDLEKELLKLTLANPAKNLLFGQNLPTITDVGGLFGQMLGNGPAKPGLLPQSVGTATITAATVIVNGGVGGLGSVGSAFADSTGGIGSSAGVTRTPLAPLADARGAFAAELADPSIRNRLFAMTEAEVGGQGPLAQQAFMESTFNRASSRGMTLDQALGDRKYFPAETFSNADRLMGSPALDAKYGDMLGRVRSGSNLSNFATGNASGTVGFGGGPMTYAAGGERFGIEKPDMSWAKELQASSTQTSQSIAEMGTRSTSVTGELGSLGTNVTQAAQSMTSAGGGISQASNQLGSTITGTAATTESAFGQLTSGLSNAFSSLFSGLGNILGSLGSGLGSLFGGLFGFDEGGWTGDVPAHAVAGVVHGREFVVKAGPAAKHRTMLEALNSGRSLPGYAVGGWVGSPPPRVASDDLPRMAGASRTGTSGSTGRGERSGAPVIQQTIVNQVGNAQVSTREEDDGRGGRRQVVLIEEAVAAATARPRSAAQKAMRSVYGIRPVVTRR